MEEIKIFIEEIEKENKKTKMEVLEKNPDNIGLEDLSYITTYDSIFSKLPYRYKQIIKVREDSEVIFSQFGKEIMTLLKDKNINEINVVTNSTKKMLNIIFNSFFCLGKLGTYIFNFSSKIYPHLWLLFLLVSTFFFKIKLSV